MRDSGIELAGVPASYRFQSPVAGRGRAEGARGHRYRRLKVQLASERLTIRTRRAYAGALRRLVPWLDSRPLGDHHLAAYLAEPARCTIGRESEERLPWSPWNTLFAAQSRPTPQGQS